MVEQTKTLALSCNAKTKFSKNHKNTFGLMFGLPENGGTCPGATVGKGGCLDIRDGKKRQTCYMAKVVQIYKAVGAVLQKNTELVQNRSKEQLKDVIRRTIHQFVTKSQTDQLFFRLNYSGDLFSEEWAQAWAEVVPEFPQVQFWLYTRSDYTIYRPLLGISNVTMFLSCDPSNFEKVNAVYQTLKDKYNNLGMAFMGDQAPEGEIHRWVRCPEITGKIKNTEQAGACSKCRLCIDRFVNRVKNIQFPIH